jgi:protein-tyrosine phosphatase
MKNVLFVCLGNICRSPMAEGIFKHKIKQLGLQSSIKSDSAGTAAYHVGEQPDPRTIQTLNKHNIEFRHAARQARTTDADKFDFIMAMDNQNYLDLKDILPSDFQGLYKMRDFDADDPGADVPDPYYGGSAGFDNVYQMLDRSIERFITEKLTGSAT